MFGYLIALLVSFGCMLAVDRRWRLVFWADARRGAVVVGVGALTFLLWDVVAIIQGFYYRGSSPYMTGWEVAPELPVEELVFIVFFCHLTLVCYRGATRLLGRRGRDTSRLPGGRDSGKGGLT